MPIPTQALHGDETGTTLDCHIQPGASKGRILGEYDNRVKIAVAAPPVDGKANAALRAFFAKQLHIPAGRVSLISGETGRKKRLHFAGIPPDELLSWLKKECGD